MDPLSEALALVKTSEYFCGALDAAGRWCVHFPKFEGVRFYAVVRGRGWLDVEGVGDPIEVSAGDCFLFPQGQAFSAGSDLSQKPLDGLALFAASDAGRTVTLNGGGEVVGLSGLFTTSGVQAATLLGLLPPIILVRTEADGAVLRWILDRLRTELMEYRPAGALMIEQLTRMVLVQVVRLHLTANESRNHGWLAALVDRQLSEAIKVIHATPARSWTVEALAKLVGMSRTSFAVRFKDVVGQSPMEYITQWKMLLAADRLTNTNASIAEIALSLGYESESAFSAAFKRFMGYPPREYSRRETVARRR